MQLKYHMITIEDLVPKDHLLREVEAMLDLSFVYEETAHLYSRKYGHPAIDPVVLVKYLLLGYLYEIPSERQIEERCKDSNAFRWYLGIDLDERVPDHSTISQLRRRKPSFRKVFRRLFERVAQQCINMGLASGRLVATDSTHVKASASLGSMYLMEAPDVLPELPDIGHGSRDHLGCCGNSWGRQRQSAVSGTDRAGDAAASDTKGHSRFSL